MKIFLYCILFVINAAISKSYGQDQGGGVSTDEDWFGNYMDTKDRDTMEGEAQGRYLEFRIC